MYAHLKMKAVTPMVVTGYRLRSKTKFEYGKIVIDAECIFPQDSAVGTVSLQIYRDDKPAILQRGKLPEYEDAADPEDAELMFLRKILPENDIVYILWLFGMRRPGSVYEIRRRALVELQKSRTRKSYERYELLFSQSVDEAWMKTYGPLLSHRKAEK